MRNTCLAIRHELYGYFRMVDDNKMSTIYHLRETDINHASLLWKNKTFTGGLDRCYHIREEGVNKGFSVA